MNEHLISDLNRFVDGRGVSISEAPGHVRLGIVRAEVSVSLLIPRTVLEWWIEVSALPGGGKIEDWCDYAGFVAAADRQLSEDMRVDVLHFIENILSRPLRIVAESRTLEWNVGGEWIQAVPLSPDVGHRAAGATLHART